LALSKLKESGDIDPKVTDKILYHNPAKFYGLEGDSKDVFVGVKRDKCLAARAASRLQVLFPRPRSGQG